jgi:hypothetical protein
MKKTMNPLIIGILIISGILSPLNCHGQSKNALIRNYLTKLPQGEVKDEGTLQKYRMTAVYTNRDLYGNFTGKTKVIGDYTSGFENGSVSWNNVYISSSNKLTEPFPGGIKQEYMEDFKYFPSKQMLEEDAFKTFPASVENVFVRNLIWDMMSIEMFAWNYSDSLILNKKYVIPEIKDEFIMADIGTYEHSGIQLCWTGISFLNEEFCGVIEYRAIDNKIKLKMDQINTKGTEQYWGTTWISLENKQIEYAEMFSGTIQEIEIKGFNDKFLVKTIRELWVERIN